jgi:hypothetical protein
MSAFPSFPNWETRLILFFRIPCHVENVSCTHFILLSQSTKLPHTYYYYTVNRIEDESNEKEYQLQGKQLCILKLRNIPSSV